jgi:sugar phosphate isomerase/epimerase
LNEWPECQSINILMFRIGIDNYGLFPAGLDPIGVLKWALRNGAEGVAFSGFDDIQRNNLDCRCLKQMREFAGAGNLYLEWGGGQHIPFDLSTWTPKDLFNHNRTAAEEAASLGVGIIRSCSGGLMRWNPQSPPTARLLDGMAKALTEQRQMLMDHEVTLAIETHFEFTTFELIRVFEACGAKPGGWLGICLDTMNLLTMLEDPVMATERILPWVVSTHIKDGGILETETGFKTFTAPFGSGIIDFERIFSLLESTGRTINLNIEDHGGDFDVPVFNPEFRREFPDLADPELEKLIALSEQTRENMTEGTLEILDRRDWPAVCESRMARDVKDLKKMINRIR